ncbi:MAG: hypothetical protein GY754_17935 [bacterium]|nr:hypothetical protein [bacterium]
MKKIIVLIITLSLTGCASKKIGSSEELVKRKFRTSENTILNYEDAAGQYTIDNKKAHFRIHIEIEKPYIIKSANYDVDTIYRVARLEGVAIYRANVGTKGTVKSYEIVKRAGMGLDSIADKIMKNIQCEPAYKLGKKRKSKIYIRIVFKGRERL